MKDKKIYIYNAGALFSEAEQNQRKRESIIFKKFFSQNYELLNPIEFKFDSDSYNLAPKSFEIFKKDYNEIQKSKYIIFDIDSKDEGTFMELGIAFEKCLKEDKYLILIFSDFRINFKNNNQIPGYSKNEMITGCFNYNERTKKRIFKTNSFKNAIKIIKDIEDKNY